MTAAYGPDGRPLDPTDWAPTWSEDGPTDLEEPVSVGEARANVRIWGRLDEVEARLGPLEIALGVTAGVVIGLVGLVFIEATAIALLFWRPL